MGVQRGPAQAVGIGAVVNLDKIAPAVMLLRDYYNAVRGGVDFGACVGAQVITAVAVPHKADNGLILHRAEETRAVGGIIQVGQYSGGRGVHGRCGGGCWRGGLGSLDFGSFGSLDFCGFGLRLGCGVYLRAYHAGGGAKAYHRHAERQRPGTKAAVVQQMHNAGLYAACAKGEAAGHGTALCGKLQQAGTVGAALRQGTPAHRGFIAGGFHIVRKLPEGQPRQRVEPMQAGHGVEQRLCQRVMAADVGLLMQQHRLPRCALHVVRHIDARAHHAQRERNGNTGTTVAAVRRFAGQCHTALQADISDNTVYGQSNYTHGPDGCRRVPRCQACVPRQRGNCCSRCGGCGGRYGRHQRQLAQLLHGIGGRCHGGTLWARQMQRNPPRQHKPQPYGQPQPAQKAAGGVGTAQQFAHGPDGQRGNAAAGAQQ